MSLLRKTSLDDNRPYRTIRVYMKYLPFLCGTLLCLGCASQTFPPGEAPDYLVLRDRAEFYRFGPLQPAPPDSLLRKDSTLKLLRREFGYSLVQTENTQTGYVANDDIIAAPNPPPEAQALQAVDLESEKTETDLTRGQTIPMEIIDDAPLPTPDMDLAPADQPEPLAPLLEPDAPPPEP